MPEEGRSDPDNLSDGVDVDLDSELSGPISLSPEDAASVVSVVSVLPTLSLSDVPPPVPSTPMPSTLSSEKAPQPVAPTASVPPVTVLASAAPAPMPTAPYGGSSPSQSQLMPAPSVPRSSTPGGEDLGLFGRYRLHQRLAMGGMAQLFLATIDGPDGFSKQCVVKTILPEFASLPDFNEMFVTEAKVTAMLHHPNIVEIYDFGREQGRYYLAMEYVRGCSLHQLLREAARANMTLGPRIAVAIGSQMCEALAYAQSLRAPDGSPLNLVHRDLSAGNILISATGMAKLTDFGIVKSDLNLNSTATGVVKGKYPYMSPEQIRGEPVDQRSDIFSLGTVLYEVSTGVSLFKRKSLADTINAVARAEVRRPSELVPNFPSQFESILMRALSLRRDDRYQSFNEMGQALDAFRLSSNWTGSSRELVSMVQTLFPGGVAPGAYQSTTSGAMPSTEAQAPTAAPTRMITDEQPGAPAKSMLGTLEIALVGVVLLLAAMIVWLIA